MRFFRHRRRGVGSYLWTGFVALTLSLGMGAGELYFESSHIEALTASKLNRNMQTFSFQNTFMGKQGFAHNRHRVSTLDVKDANPLQKHKEPLKSGIKAACLVRDPSVETVDYSGELVEVKVSPAIDAGDEFRVEVYVKNTGNMNWYGLDSGCEGKTLVHMGTWHNQDRLSSFFAPGPSGGWIGGNRVKMVEDVVQPGETATFAFVGEAPTADTIYREYFNLVAEHVSWFSDLNIPVDIRVGTVTEDDEFKLQFLKHVSADTRSLEGERNLFVDLSEQKMRLRFGDRVVYSLTISSGAWDTPTPVGSFKVLNQQELRIGGAPPHYRMPYWQGFTKMGHGLHALPYLGDPGGWFWEEALDHIGIPVSHGCIRLLPDDAVLVYEFGGIGTPITIQR